MLFSYLEERFGIHEQAFVDFDLFSKRKSWWLLRKTVNGYLPVRLKVSQVGLRAFDKVGRYLKPTTRMIQLFGHHATRGFHQVDESGLQRLSRGESLEIDGLINEGFVILLLREHVLGVGLLAQGKITARIKKYELNQISER